MAPDSSQNKINIENDEISLNELTRQIGEWCKYFLKKWLFIILFGFIGGALGLTYSIFKKPVYTATTNFVLENSETAGLGQYAGLASMVGIDIDSKGGIFQGDNLLELYRSRKMIQKTLLSQVDSNSKKLLIDYYIKFNKLRESWGEKAELKDIQFSNSLNETERNGSKEVRRRDSILGVIVNDINLNYLTVGKLDKKSSIIKVDVKSKDEEFAKLFNDYIVKNVSEFYIQTKTKKALENVVILTQKTDSVRNIMNGAIYTAVAVADATPNLNPTRQVQRTVPAQKAQFSAESNKALLSSLVQNLEMSKLSLLKETPLIQIVDQPVYPLKVETFGKLKGIVMGGLLAGFIAIAVLIVGRLFGTQGS